MGSSFCTGVQSHTYVTSNLGRTTRFLVDCLGLKLEHRTVHNLNAEIGAAFFSFPAAAGAPFVAYVEWAPVFYEMPTVGLIERDASVAATHRPAIGDPKGRFGAGTNHHLALHVNDRAGLLKWKRWLVDKGVLVTGPYFRNYFHAIYFHDPDGAIVEIATTEPGFRHDEEVLGSGHRKPPPEALVGMRSELEVAAEQWPEPIEAITHDMALRGFHHITSISSDAERTVDFLVEKIGLDLIKRTDYLDAAGTHFYYSAGQDLVPGNIITYFGLPSFPGGRLGTGLAHHFTLTASDDTALDDWREDLLRKGVDAGAVQDRYFFREFFFHDPDGHIVSIATRPNFATGAVRTGTSGLSLPDGHERRRGELEAFHALHPAPTARTTDVQVAVR